MDSCLRTFASAFCHNPTGLGVGALHWILRQPPIQISLEFHQTQRNLLAERDARELIEDGLVEPLDDPVGLRTLPLGAGMVDMLHRQVPFIDMSVGTATVPSTCRRRMCLAPRKTLVLLLFSFFT
jgi:hypothetical protein